MNIPDFTTYVFSTLISYTKQSEHFPLVLPFLLLALNHFQSTDRSYCLSQLLLNLVGSLMNAISSVLFQYLIILINDNLTQRVSDG